MRSSTSVFVSTWALGALVGCSAGLGPTNATLAGVGSGIPPLLQPTGVKRLHLDDHYVTDATASGLIYVSDEDALEVFAYPNPNKQNKAPTCTLGTSQNWLNLVYGFGVDTAGNVAIPAYTPDFSGLDSINVFKPNCGGMAWQQQVPGEVADAYSRNALSGNVLVSLSRGPSSAGAILLCSSSGCGTPFTNSAVTGTGAGVAMARNGDCWFSAAQQGSSGFVLVYFQGCTGPGEAATGTSNAYDGGLFIDTKGNLGSIDQSGKLNVYRGCNPACKLVSTSTLHGSPFYGGLDAKGTHFAVADYATNSVDVYSYSPTKGAKYSYSFNNGFEGTDTVFGAHFAPMNKKT